jgi:hypothetical protein
MHDDERHRARGHVNPVIYHAVVHTQPANPEVAPYVLCGTLTPVEIHRLWDSLVGLARTEGHPIDVEISLAGDQKETAAYELAERLAGLSNYDITFRVG